MKSYIPLLALAASVEATFKKNAPAFSCPENTDNKCTPKQNSGFDWSDLVTGPFTNYGDFNFKGFTCGGGGGGTGRSGAGGGGKFIGGTCHPEKSKSPSFGSKDNFSVGSIRVEPEFDCDLEFHYEMPNGSVCKHRNSCKKSGTTVVNKQCGGAKGVTIIYPPQPGKPKPSCSIKVPTVSFDCSTASSTKTPSSTKATSTKATSTKATSTKATSTAVTTTSGVKTTSTSAAKPESSTSAAPATSTTVPAESSTSTAPAQTSTAPVESSTAPGQTSTAPGETSTAPGETSTAPGETSTAPGETSTAVVPGSSTKPVETSTAPGETSTAPGKTSTDVSPESSTATAATSTPITTVITTEFESTSTIFTTVVSTITSCAPEVPNCPASGGVTTTVVTVAVSTTICPVTETRTTVISSPTAPAGGASSVPAGGDSSAPVGVETTSAPIGGGASTTVAVGTTLTAVKPIETLPCPDVVPSCVNTFMFSVGCKDSTDTACYCPDALFVKNVYDCLYAHGESDQIISEAVIFFQGICAPWVGGNPAVVTAPTVTSYLTVTAAPTAAPVYTTITVDATTVVPCTDEAGQEIPSSSTTVIISTTMQVPQIGFTTGVQGGVDLIPITAAPVIDGGNGGSEGGNNNGGGAVVTTNGTTIQVPTGTGSVRPTSSVVLAGSGRVGTSFGLAAAVAALAAFAL